VEVEVEVRRGFEGSAELAGRFRDKGSTSNTSTLW
jgi:hypothetical protein